MRTLSHAGPGQQSSRIAAPALTSRLAPAASQHAGPAEPCPAGRVPTILAMRLASNVLLMLLGLLPSLWPRHAVVIAMYLARAALANAPYPIERAIIMDYVPKSMRAKWSSLESVLGFGWSGSAVAGGFLLDSYGFQFTFVTTALLQAIGTLVRTAFPSSTVPAAVACSLCCMLLARHVSLTQDRLHVGKV